MKNFYSSNTRKGQSAIEYLMTYGWMLLVVAIVGGAIFATVQNQRQECSGQVPVVLEASQNDGFGVTNFGVTTNNVQVELTNNGQDTVDVQSVYLDSTESDETSSGSVTLNVGGSETFTLSGWSSSDSCTEATLNMTYNQGGITGQVMEGNITAQMSSP